VDGPVVRFSFFRAEAGPGVEEKGGGGGEKRRKEGEEK